MTHLKEASVAFAKVFRVLVPGDRAPGSSLCESKVTSLLPFRAGKKGWTGILRAPALLCSDVWAPLLWKKAIASQDCSADILGICVRDVPLRKPPLFQPLLKAFRHAMASPRA